MVAIRRDLSKSLSGVEIHTFADLHIGDKHCDKNSIREQVDYVKDTENAYAILNGDIINNATKTSVSDSYAEELTPSEQITEFESLFAPIKDKILMITSGNHENRTYIKEGVDITQICARQLHCENAYAKNGGVLFLRVGLTPEKRKTSNGSIRQNCYVIYACHGSGGGRKEGAKAIRLADMASIVDADIYIHSHTHLPMIMKQAFYRVNQSNSSVAKVDKLFVNTSAKLDYGGYGQAFEFKPSSTDTPVIYLDGTRKFFTAKL